MWPFRKKKEKTLNDDTTMHNLDGSRLTVIGSTNATQGGGSMTIDTSGIYSAGIFCTSESQTRAAQAEAELRELKEQQHRRELEAERDTKKPLTLRMEGAGAPVLPDNADYKVTTEGIESVEVEIQEKFIETTNYVQWGIGAVSCKIAASRLSYSGRIADVDISTLLRAANKAHSRAFPEEYMDDDLKAVLEEAVDE